MYQERINSLLDVSFYMVVKGILKLIQTTVYDERNIICHVLSITISMNCYFRPKYSRTAAKGHRPWADTSHKRTWSCSYKLHTNTTFLTSHKRTPLLSGHFLWSRRCPLTEGLTVNDSENQFNLFTGRPDNL